MPLNEACPIPQSLTGLPVTGRALAYAEQMHAGQSRSADGAPFIVHPVEVACLLCDVGAADHVIAAGVLHDVIEKTDADAADLGERVRVLNRDAGGRGERGQAHQQLHQT